jgi:epoxide hydrolase-like predicted phosphatase
MPAAVIFDFGGVLMKTVDYQPRHAWDDRLGLPRGSVERAVHNDSSWLQAQTGNISPAAYWADVAARLGLSAADTRQLAVDFYSGDRLDAEIVAYIHNLRARGHRVALLSNDSLELLPKLERLEIAGLFDPLVVSAQIGVLKPEAAAYQTVLARLDAPPQAAVFIDDRADNIEGARRVGLRTVHYRPGMDLPAAVDALLA